MKRPLIISLALGGVLSLALILLLSRSGGPASNTAPSVASSASRPPRDSTTRLTKAEENRILLGDVAAVPFQETYGLLSKRTPEEIAALARQLQGLPPSAKSDAKIAAFFKTWATLDPTAAFAAAIAFRPAQQENTIGAVLQGADPSEAGSLVTSINELPKESLPANAKTNLLARAISKWSQVDPVAAAKFLDSTSERGMNFSMAWNATASNWAALDPVAALDWARQAAQKGERFAMSGAILGWSKNDPQAAEAYVASHLATREDWQLAGTLAGNMFQEDPERAKKWASQLPNEEARRQADHMIAIQWAFSDPAAATQWSSNLPRAERTTTLGESMGLWALQDPTAAAKWLGQYEGPGRDEAVQTFSLNVAPKDPATALSWAATIADPKLRASAEEQLAGDWLKRDRHAATGWIQNSSLPADEKSRLLSPGR
ncbi:MAG TPA: hypothetical protein VH207_13170 [Chthoniobacterales bacterium]|nr:hypothetical protein [Chthoniobacterales bacterium]